MRDWSSLVTPQTLFTHGIGPQPVGKSSVTISRKLNKRLLAQFKEGSSDFPPTFPAKRKKKKPTITAQRVLPVSVVSPHESDSQFPHQLVDGTMPLLTEAAVLPSDPYSSAASVLGNAQLAFKKISESLSKEDMMYLNSRPPTEIVDRLMHDLARVNSRTILCFYLAFLFLFIVTFYSHVRTGEYTRVLLVVSSCKRRRALHQYVGFYSLPTPSRFTSGT